MAEKTTRLTAMKTLWELVRPCRDCAISSLARNKVFGDGNVYAKIFLVGEAPGMEEDACGHPFVGTASSGKILEKTLKAAGLVRKELFITNCLKCHPPKEVLPEVKGNRSPLPQELESCVDYLHTQIALVRPKVIVTLGAVALNLLANPQDRMSHREKRGMSENFRRFWKTDESPEWGLPTGAVLVAAYHPQYLSRKHDEKIESEYIRLFRMVREIAEGKKVL